MGQLKMRKRTMQAVSFFKGTAIFLLCALFLIVHAKETRAGDATINWTQVEQKISGFGASSAFTSGAISNWNLADFFFNKDTGIGLSILRTRIPPDGDWADEASAMVVAKERGVTQIWSAAWTPPAKWKSNNNPYNGGTLLPEHYRDYANYLAQYIKDIKNVYGVELYAISIQNEPEVAAKYESCLWSAEAFVDFIKNHLRPVFAANSITTKVMMPESAGNNLSLSDPTLNDRNAAAGVDIIGAHLYEGGPFPYPLAASKGKEYWETEISDFNRYDGSMTSGLKYAKLIHDCLTYAQMNAFHYWWLAPFLPEWGGNLDNQGLIHWKDVVEPGELPYDIPKRTYCIGNFSKFIRPGYDRIGATANPTTNVYVSAYKNDSTDDFVIVAINKGTSSITQKFVLNNFTAGTVTPWITSGTLNLAQQGSVNVSGNSFSYSLPAKSVCSFVGTAGKITVTAPASGEDWVIGTSHKIEWTSAYVTGQVGIELGRPLGCSYEWSSIIGSASNDGIYTWKVTSPAQNNCIIRVTSLNTSNVYGNSDPFNIVSTTTTSIRPTTTTTSLRPTTTTSLRPTTTTTSVRPTTTTSVRPTTNTKTIAPLLSVSPTSLTFTAEWGTTQLGYFQAGKHFMD